METEHPTEERWEAFACGELDAASRRALLEHAAACELCDKTRRALDDLREGARFFDPGVPRRRPSAAPWVAAGTMAAVAAAMILFIRPEASDEETLRSGSREAALVIHASEGGLSWDAVPGATEYVVRVYTETGELVFSKSTPTTSATPKLPPAKYRWEVEALADGRRLARSRLERL
jgi:hypothetical protein